MYMRMRSRTSTSNPLARIASDQNCIEGKFGPRRGAESPACRKAKNNSQNVRGPKVVTAKSPFSTKQSESFNNTSNGWLNH